MQVLRESRPSATTRRIRSRSRKNSHEFSVVNDRNCANVAFDHGAHGLKNGVAQIRLIGLLIFNQVADTHLIPPGKQKSEQFQGIYRGASICQKPEIRKEKRLGGNECATCEDYGRTRRDFPYEWPAE